MPVLSKFYGIVIRMFVAPSLRARFHAIYGNNELVVGLAPLAILNGEAPPRVRDMVLEWAAQHESELLESWNRCRRAEKPLVIAPLH